jgi:hypothetical protein
MLLNVPAAAFNACAVLSQSLSKYIVEGILNQSAT